MLSKLLEPASKVDFLQTHWKYINEGYSIGLEKELLVVNKKGNPVSPSRQSEIITTLSREIMNSPFIHSRCYAEEDSKTGGTAITELVTQPTIDIESLGENYLFLLDTLHQKLHEDETIVQIGEYEGIRMATQINLGAKSVDEAIFLANAYREHLPEFIVLSMNSQRIRKIYNNEPLELLTDDVDSISKYLKVRSTIASGVSKKFYFLTKKSTLELRICDSQVNPKLDLMIAAYAFAIHNLALNSYRNHREYPIRRNNLNMMYSSTFEHGFDAQIDGLSIVDIIEASLDYLGPFIHQPFIEIIKKKIS